MPRVRHGADCDCCGPAPASQSLAEVAFARSACAAAQSGDVARVEALLQRNPALLSSDGCEGSSGYTPLHYAARGGHLDVAALLLARGADPNAATHAGRATPLHRAAYCGHAAVAELLLRHGADPRLRDADGQTAADKARAQGHGQLAEQLGAAPPPGPAGS